MNRASVLTDTLDTVPDLSPEWQSVISGRHNLLLEGPMEWTEPIVRYLVPLVTSPVTWTTSQTLRTLPVGESGTLVLRDIAALRRDDQARVFEWLQGGERQVISTTTESLFDKLVDGSFDGRLYYRLNVIRMCASHSASTADGLNQRIS